MKISLTSLLTGNSLRVFAYGSLLWKPCFEYERQVVGYIKGFKRRFFQGNTNLRGTKAHPGRVAILIPDEEEVTWGVVYEVRGKERVQSALEHLYVRENKCGDYHCIAVQFYPRGHATPSTIASTHTGNNSADEDSDPDSDSDLDFASDLEPFTVFSFTASLESRFYMGSADISTMAMQVVAAEGKAGPNSEYVLKTAEYVRRYIPEDQDQHLFQLETAIRELLTMMQTQPVHHDFPSLHAVTVVV